jgi:hypothetical protein
MFLTAPTIKELQALELPQLIDMLTAQTFDYVEQFKREGFSFEAYNLRENILNIQAAIEIKKNLAKNNSNRDPDVSSTLDAIRIDPVP